MKIILSMTIVALFSATLAGCWFYSRPDSTSAGCQKTTYGIALATTSNENCPPSTEAGAAQPQSPPPPIPPPATP
jgi:hypothetical protein